MLEYLSGAESMFERYSTDIFNTALYGAALLVQYFVLSSIYCN